MAFVYFIVGLVVLIVIWSALDQIRLSRHRGVSREAFVNEFASMGISSEIPAAVYDHYRSLSRAKSFSVAPDDSFERTFHQAHDDVDDDAEELTNKLGMELPIEEVLREWPTPLETLRDMVLWLNWIRQRQDGVRG
jgi:hypothetical protein